MTAKDKLIEWLIEDGGSDTCAKCVFAKKYDEYADLDEVSCEKFYKDGNAACRVGMLRWFEQQQQKEKTIGQRIKEKRISLGLKQDELAKKLGVLQITVSKWELDENIPTTLTLMCLADIFDCTTDELLGR